MKPFLGCIADDVTGASDLAINLVQGGMRVIQWLDVPTPAEIGAHDCDAIVLALKTRSCIAQRAIDESLKALQVLRESGCQRYFFKYCSTFDSTDRGNIGPVSEALVDALGCDQVVYCPAFPRNGRTLYRGYLFVGGQLLHESSMATHPLTPMREPNLVKVLQRQTNRGVGLVEYDAVAAGADAIRERITGLVGNGRLNVLVDCCDDQHLANVASACWDHPLITGGSALCGFLPDVWQRHGLWQRTLQNSVSVGSQGRSLILSGSCSNATNAQVAAAESSCECWRIDIDKLLEDAALEQRRVLGWATKRDSSRPLLIFSTADSASVDSMQRKYGREAVAKAIEEFHGNIAQALVSDAGVTRIVVAGGETAGAVVAALGIRGLRIGPQICPGVPWTEPIDRKGMALALKSGNFGGEHFFLDALGMLP